MAAYINPEFKVIGGNLKRLRKNRGLSVDEVRGELFLGSVQAVYKWERGEGLPQADTLLSLMRLYGVSSIDELFVESDSLSYLFFYRTEHI